MAFWALSFLWFSAPEYENVWRNQIFLTLKLLGMHVASEVHTSSGRCDCVVQTKNFVYVFEFKLDQTAQEALYQIDSRDYACQYEADRRKTFKIGVNFLSEKRNIEKWKIVEDD